MNFTSVAFTTVYRPPRGLLRKQYPLLNLVWLGTHIGIAIAVLLTLALLQFGEVSEPYKVLAIVIGLTMLPVYQWSGLFERVRTRMLIVDLGLLLRSFAVTSAVLLPLGYATATLGHYPHDLILAWALVTFAAQSLAHLAIRGAIGVARRFSLNVRRALLIGGGDSLRTFPAVLAGNPWLGIEVVGYLQAHPTAESVKADDHRPQLPYLGTIDDLSRVIDTRSVDVIYLAMPMEQTPLVSSIAHRLLDFSVDVFWVPDLSDFLLIGHGVREIDGYPILAISESPMNGLPRLLKRALDICVAALALLILSPIMLGVAALVKLTSPGPVIYRQLRHGINGSPIVVWKFRSMYTSRATKDGHQVKANDPDVTAVGRLIRRWSIDELPQLFQVLRGTMSLVGPRPHPIWLNEKFHNLVDGYMQRHRVKPGMTGWAQINGWRGETESVEKMEMRLRHDVFYIQNWSLWLDIRILLMTPFTVFRGENAF